MFSLGSSSTRIRLPKHKMHQMDTYVQRCTLVSKCLFLQSKPAVVSIADTLIHCGHEQSNKLKV